MNNSINSNTNIFDMQKRIKLLHSFMAFPLKKRKLNAHGEF